MEIEKIIAITGKTSLYEILSQNKKGVIARCLMTGKKNNFSLQQTIHSLSEITVFTDEEEMKLAVLLSKIYQHTAGKIISKEFKTNEAKLKFLLEIVPDLDLDKFYPSHAKKVVGWFNILIESGYLEENKPSPSKTPNNSEETSESTAE